MPTLSLILAVSFALAIPTASAAPTIILAIHQDVDECEAGSECVPDNTIMCISTDPNACTGIPCVTAPPWCK